LHDVEPAAVRLFVVQEGGRATDRAHDEDAPGAAS
jgi:hypothetical protein